jgi:eukaryotic-like serine/threonine-protein kinase
MIGKTVSHYEILEKLGEGGMGVVYKAHDTRLDRIVAIKFLPRQIAVTEEERERFLVEARAAAALNHPNIATIHAIEEDAGELFIVMEYVEGEELKAKISRGPLQVPHALDIAIQITEGLQAAHRKGIVHRDIKSSNIMLTGTGQAKIMDFGLAKLPGGALVTKVGSTLGTVAYMSPEQTRGDAVDQRSDLWSFGVVLYEMLTGQLPFGTGYEQAVMYSILNEEPRPITSLRPELPAALVKIVDRALAKSSEARYPSAAELITDLKAVHATAGPQPVPLKSSRRFYRDPRKIVPVLVGLLAFLAVMIWWLDHHRKAQWARLELLPEIEKTIENVAWTGEGPKPWEAFERALKAEQYIADDPLLARLWSRFTRPVKILSVPAGTKFYARPYAPADTAWRYFGTTPIAGLRLPLGFSRVKLEREGSRPAHDLIWNVAALSDTLVFVLNDSVDVPQEMEFVPGASSSFDLDGPSVLHMPGLENKKGASAGDFLMDRREVTNREYKSFVDAGGYDSPRYWKQPFVKDGRPLTWAQAMQLFVDKTGKHGPSTWEVSDYPKGQDDFPVSGVSWYEAAAYADFAGKSLPTIYHWDRAAFTWASPEIVPVSNLNGNGPRSVLASTSLNRFGIYDLSGNVREWCFNSSTRTGERFILGGGWNDPGYAFNDAFTQLSFDRSETNGFRCIKYLGAVPQRAVLEETVALPFRDFLHEPRISEAMFRLFLKQYDYDRTDLHPVVESVREESEWRREKVSFAAAYGAERMFAYLFLPKNASPPYQTVLFFPGSGALTTRSSDSLEPGPRVDFIIKAGRALMYPVYKSTFERGDNMVSDYPEETNTWKDHIVMWGKDVRRSIDYLATRNDIDTAKIAYFGASWGGAMGAIMPAIEPRLRVVTLLVAGMNYQRAFPEVEPVNYLPHIKVPVLMLNGKYDFFFPYETSQRPFFELLGTPKEKKKIFVYEGGHTVPRTEMVKEMLAWFDQYLGPVGGVGN